MVDFKYTKWNEKIVSQIPFSTKQKKTNHKMEIQSKNSKQQYLIIVVHHLCDDPLYGKRKTFSISSLGITFRFIVKLYSNKKQHLLKCSCNVFSNFEC
jgi:hypothetical protein